MTHLCITVRWHDDRYHGLLGRDGPPEWPPSPFRLFQALVAGVARRGELDSEIGKSLEWLQSLEPPIIIAPRSQPGHVVTRFVPNNDGDKVPDRQNRLAGKTSRPMLMLDAPEIRYLWPLPGDCPQTQAVAQAARHLACLGLGVDMAYAGGEVVDDGQVGRFSGVRWLPKSGTLDDSGLLRVPVDGSMADLIRAHQSSLKRIELSRPLRAVDKPQVFDRVFYASTARPLGRPYVFFALRTSGDESYSYPHAKLVHIAGMTRSAAIKAMQAYPPDDLKAAEAAAWVDAFVAGHRAESVDVHRQFSYIPLPSIGYKHADALIRRVIIAAPFGSETQLRHLADQLDGKQLQREGGGEGPILERMRPDMVASRYLTPSRIWASVTPVILPGHDDHKPEKTVKLIEKALLQSGIEQGCRYTWASLPNFNNCLTASKHDRNGRRTGYFRPGHLDELSAVHIRMTFENPVTGPLAVGSGRHCGLGVLAALSEE